VINIQEKAGVQLHELDRYRLPGTAYHSSMFRRVAGRLGLDFVVAGIKFANRQLGEY
jgi:hypothetical protein